MKNRPPHNGNLIAKGKRLRFAGRTAGSVLRREGGTGHSGVLTPVTDLNRLLAKNYMSVARMSREPRCRARHQMSFHTLPRWGIIAQP